MKSNKQALEVQSSRFQFNKNPPRKINKIIKIKKRKRKKKNPPRTCCYALTTTLDTLLTF